MEKEDTKKQNRFQAETPISAGAVGRARQIPIDLKRKIPCERFHVRDPERKVPSERS